MELYRLCERRTFSTCSEGMYAYECIECLSTILCFVCIRRSQCIQRSSSANHQKRGNRYTRQRVMDMMNLVPSIICKQRFERCCPIQLFLVEQILLVVFQGSLRLGVQFNIHAKRDMPIFRKACKLDSHLRNQLSPPHSAQFRRKAAEDDTGRHTLPRTSRWMVLSC